MKLIIAGGRDFDNPVLMDVEVNAFLHRASVLDIDPYKNLVIVSGGALGADKLGEKWASKNNAVTVVFPAQWLKYGLSAGPKRNREMAEFADACIVFWDGKSKGTANMIENAKKLNLPLKIVNYGPASEH